MRQAHRFAGPGGPYEGLTRVGKRGVDWAGKAMLVPGMLDVPLRRRKPTTYFVNSMSDLFHESLTNEDIAAVFGVMAMCPQHTFQILTKRAERMREWFEWAADLPGRPARTVAVLHAEDALRRWPDGADYWRGPWPLPNVWLGVSAEDQQRADERIPHLLQTPAAVRFVSVEPMVGPIELFPWLTPNRIDCNGCTPDGRLCPGHVTRPAVDWVIVGGESGPMARPCHVEWIRSVVAQCKAAGVACFVKQLGAYVVSEARACDTDEEAKELFGFGSRWCWRASLQDRKGGDRNEWPDNLQVREYPGR